MHTFQEPSLVSYEVCVEEIERTLRGRCNLGVEYNPCGSLLWTESVHLGLAFDRTNRIVARTLICTRNPTTRVVFVSREHVLRQKTQEQGWWHFWGDMSDAR